MSGLPPPYFERGIFEELLRDVVKMDIVDSKVAHMFFARETGKDPTPCEVLGILSSGRSGTIYKIKLVLDGKTVLVAYKEGRNPEDVSREHKAVEILAKLPPEYTQGVIPAVALSC